MNIWIDDHYKYVIMTAILKEEKEFVETIIEQDDYINEQDRFEDLEYLNAINVLLKNYEVQDGNS